MSAVRLSEGIPVRPRACGRSQVQVVAFGGPELLPSLPGGTPPGSGIQRGLERGSVQGRTFPAQGAQEPSLTEVGGSDGVADAWRGHDDRPEDVPIRGGDRAVCVSATIGAWSYVRRWSTVFPFFRILWGTGVPSVDQ